MLVPRKQYRAIYSTTTSLSMPVEVAKTHHNRGDNAAKASRVLLIRVNCKAMGVPGMAASNMMPILASGDSGKTRTSKTPIAGTRMQLAASVRTIGHDRLR
jgi:hypothetical protein